LITGDVAEFPALTGFKTTGVATPVVALMGQLPRVTGYWEQFELLKQTFKVKGVCWAPRQKRMRLPSVTWAVIQFTPITGLDTRNVAVSGRIRTACGSLFTQNWHWSVTSSIPVTGIKAVEAALLAVLEETVETPCPGGTFVSTGGGVKDGKLQDEHNKTNTNAPIKNLRENNFIPRTPLVTQSLNCPCQL